MRVHRLRTKRKRGASSKDEKAKSLAAFIMAPKRNGHGLRTLLTVSDKTTL